MVLSLASRQASFLSLPEWVSHQWNSTNHLDFNYLQILLDDGFQIPVLLETFDRMSDLPWSHTNSQVVSHITKEAWKLLASMKKWEKYIRGGDDTLQLYCPRLSRGIATDNGMSDIINVFPVSYDFPSFHLAAALMYYEMFKISLFNFLIDIIHRYPDTKGIDIPDLRIQSIECADKICRSMEYFLDKSTRITGHLVIMGPFQSARDLFTTLLQIKDDSKLYAIDLHKKLNFCNAIMQKFELTGLLISNRQSP